MSVASLADLWYSTQKSSSTTIPRGAYDAVEAAVTNPALSFELAPITVGTMAHFDVVPLSELRDPFDRFIVATALDLSAPLVTADRAITKTGAVPVVW